MHIVHYPHPTLRHKSKPLKHVDAELRKMIQQMFELMYHANGVGLASNQVDLPFRLFVMNLAADSDQGDELVFINPVLSRPKGSEENEEGCLSLPELYGEVKRPERVHLSAYGLDGQLLETEMDGLLARVVQHEVDHLDGVLFVDRLSTTGAMATREAIETFESEFAGQRARGEISNDQEIAQRLADLEKQYC